jgi:hypothetical protein
MKILVTLALFAGIAQTNSTPLIGTWKLVEQTTTGPAGKTTPANQPGLLIFTGKYYSTVADRSDAPRPDEDKNTTAAQLLASRTAFDAAAGTYEVSGTTLTRHPIVAANPNIMHSDSVQTATFKVTGKTLLITVTGNSRGPLANPTTLKYTRVE